MNPSIWIFCAKDMTDHPPLDSLSDLSAHPDIAPSHGLYPKENLASAKGITLGDLTDISAKNTAITNIMADAMANGLPVKQSVLNSRLKRIGFAIMAFIYSPAVRILLSHRAQKKLLSKRNIAAKYLARFLRIRTMAKWGCDISPMASIAPGVKLPHPLGIIIGSNVCIHPGARIFHQVTLGQNGQDLDHNDMKNAPNHPQQIVIEPDATIFTAAKIFGPARIGSGARIGAAAIIFTDIPAHKTIPSGALIK